MSNDGAAPRAAVPVSNARAEASRRNGARSRGPKTARGKARSAQNALRHGMRALKYVVLPDEDAVEFQALEAALVDELAPVGALQTRARAPRRGRRLAAGAGRSHGGRAVRGAALGERRPRHGADPRRQRHPQLRDAPALPRRRHGRVLARAQDAQGAAGRAGGVLEQPAGADLRRSCPPARRAGARACAAAPTGSAPRTPIPADRTNPSASWPTCCPNRPSAGPALHEPAASAPRRPEPNEPERRLGRRRPPHPRRQPVAALRLGPICRCSEQGPPLLGSIGGTLLELGPEPVSKRQRQA